MRDHFGILFSAIFLFVGAGILYDGIVSHDANQSARVIAGAAILALGFTTMRLILKSWWRERKSYREWRNPSGGTDS